MKRWIWTKHVSQWDDAAQEFCTLESESQGYWYDGSMALCMDNPVMSQDSIQVFNDDGTDETDSTSKAGVGVDITDQALDENLLVRFLVKETAGFANANFKPQIQIRLDGGTYQVVDGVSTIGRSFDSTKLTDGGDTTQRIGSGTFLSSNAGVDDVNGVAGKNAINFVGNDETEFVYCLQIRSADVNGGQNVEIRIGDSFIDSYVDTEIKITIASDGAISATVPMVIGAPTVDLEGDGKLDVTIALIFGAPVVDLTDATLVGPIDATVPMVFAAPVVDLEGQGKLDALAAMVIGAPVVDLEGQGKLDAMVALTIGAPTVDLEGDGKLDALVQMLIDAPTVDLEGDGKLDATVPMVIGAPAVDLKGDGKLDATVPMVIGAPSVNLTNATPPLGEITATVPMVIGAPSVDLEGDGKLDATVALAFAKSSADLEGSGKLDALVQMIFGAPSVDLEGKGKLDATVPMVFSATVVNLTDASIGAISATVPMAFSKVLANLVNATPPVGGATKRHLGPFMLRFAT